MIVLQTVGPDAGTAVDLPTDVAERKLRDGTAAPLDHLVRIRHEGGTEVRVDPSLVGAYPTRPTGTVEDPNNPAVIAASGVGQPVVNIDPVDKTNPVLSHNQKPLTAADAKAEQGVSAPKPAAPAPVAPAPAASQPVPQPAPDSKPAK